jgi:hypothetical protein
MTRNAARSARHHDGWRSRAYLAALLVVSLSAIGLVLSGSAFAATPSISVSPSTGLSNGQTVTVHITGFTPGANNINIVECPVSGASQNACDVTDAKLFQTVDSSGSKTVQMTVRAKLGSVDCTVAACMIDAHEGTSATSGNNAQENIQFGATPTSSAPTSPGSGSTSGSGGSGGAGGNASSTPAAGGSGPTGANTGHVDVGTPRIGLSLLLAGLGLALVAVGMVVHLRRTRAAR